MNIGFYIGTLLYKHDCVVIPGFGGFIANYAPACIHPVQNTFIPPSRKIMFNASLLHNDGLLATHIAKEEGISYAQALLCIDDEVVAIHTEFNAGKAVILSGFGSLRTNHENSIVFTPKADNNWLEDAYGLPTFVSPAIRRNGYQSNHDTIGKRKGIHLPVAVRRVAAIAVPLIAIGMWSLFNTEKINNFTSSYSSIFPYEIFSPFSISPIKNSVPVYVLSHARASEGEHHFTPIDTKEAILNVNTGQTIFNRATTEVKSEPNVTTPQSPLFDNKIKETGHFLIICGAFKVKENAEKLLVKFKAKNFDAAIAGQNTKGLYLVSVASCDDAGEAALKLKEILGKGITAAWILNK